MCKSWKTYLLWFAQEHVEFRYAEIESLLSLFKIDMRYLEQPKNEPFWIVQFSSENDIKLLASRSVSLRNCLELWCHAKSIPQLHDKLKCFPRNLMEQHFKSNRSFKIEVETFCKHFTQAEKINKIEAFRAVSLTNPDVIFQYIEYYGTEANNPPELPYEVASGLRQLIKKISLKTRKFIGNTSMDPQLSLLMANQARIKDGAIVLDPFVGTGSLLVAAAQFGGFVLGTDIDYLMLHGRTKPSRIKQKVRDKNESIRSNMQQYNLEHRYLDVLVNDFAVPFWRDDIQFDAIITDPPYGIREATERVGTIKENYTVEEKHLSTHVPAKIEYGISNIYRDLLRFSAKHLKNRRPNEDYNENCLPSHPCLKLVANCEQGLSKVTSRRLLTFEKINHPTDEELRMTHNGIMDFREKYFIVREETRKERRTKEARIREENRLKYGKNQDK
ncbi:hypothetical protein NQ317_019869 [Molorchus minor]|uniref:tRNA (guanine(10)-N(2))-methyltransferase TRMT11 n=1 Tax=Molorchus minor TaxID=1323400 RepID=A0ABQ9J8Y7_9CUCU|nr:hypothetical protein NQ317_019869 [Molorchus minor]